MLDVTGPVGTVRASENADVLARGRDVIRTKLQRREGTVRVTFALPADAPPASVVGDFNGWDPYAAPLRRRSNGTRSAVVEVPEGAVLRFRYLVDGGQWWDDPDADQVRLDDGSQVSLLTV